MAPAAAPTPVPISAPLPAPYPVPAPTAAPAPAPTAAPPSVPHAVVASVTSDRPITAEAILVFTVFVVIVAPPARVPGNTRASRASGTPARKYAQLESGTFVTRSDRGKGTLPAR